MQFLVAVLVLGILQVRDTVTAQYFLKFHFTRKFVVAKMDAECPVSENACVRILVYGQAAAGTVKNIL